MKEIMKELDRLSKQRVSELQKAKKSGKLVIQYTGNFIPEEMIKAAGAEPYLMCRGGEPEPPDAVLEDMLRFMNPLARSMAGFNELGLDPVTPISDLIVMQQTDCHVGRISELFEFQELPVWKIGVPSEWKKEIAFEYYVRSLEKFKEKLEEMTGNPLDKEVFKNELEKTNKLHEALRKIDSLRKKENPPIGLTEFIRLNHYSFTVDKDIMTEKLNELYDKLKDAPGKFNENSPKILFCGRALAIGDYTVPRLLEESGGVIVSDFMDEGIRPYRNDYTINEDPLLSFAKTAYLERPPINIFQPAWEDRFEYMKGLIKDYDVDGVVWYQLSFDEIYDMEYTVLAKWMGELNIPIIKMESSYEYSREAMGPLTTRIESFVESLKGAYENE
jgi:benzoyl-CoA reductase/2-hydroxyglutaryl-CoA dehydratase subunit BcrC/BadD/HgdB